MIFKKEWSPEARAEAKGCVRRVWRVIRTMPEIGPKLKKQGWNQKEFENLFVFWRRDKGSYYRIANPKISINFGPQLEQKTEFVEYARLAKDPVIGNVPIKVPYMYLKCLIVHEAAHFVQHHAEQTSWRNGEPTKMTSHGPTFRACYAYLRHRTINLDQNPYIDTEWDSLRAA